GKRIPFARKVDFETGKWEALLPTPDGKNVVTDEHNKVVVLTGQAERPKLVPMEHAHLFGVKEPEPVQFHVIPVSAEAKLQGQQQYERVFKNVWQYRGE